MFNSKQCITIQGPYETFSRLHDLPLALGQNHATYQTIFCKAQKRIHMKLSLAHSNVFKPITVSISHERTYVKLDQDLEPGSQPGAWLFAGVDRGTTRRAIDRLLTSRLGYLWVRGIKPRSAIFSASFCPRQRQ